MKEQTGSATHSTGNSFGRGRRDWDYAALDSFVTLGNHYLDSRAFRIELGKLLAGFSVPAPMLGIDQADPVNPDSLPSFFTFDVSDMGGRRGDPRSAVDLFLPTNMPGPGPIDNIEAMFSRRWKAVAGSLGEDHPWVAKVHIVAQTWGLRAPWAEGVLLVWMGEVRLRKERQRGHRPTSGLWFNLESNFRRLPHLKVNLPWPFEPVLTPSTTDKEWSDGIARYKREGQAYVEALRREASKTGLWRPQYKNLERDARWLFARITPPYKTPRVIAVEQDVSAGQVENGIRKAAKLLHITVHKGDSRPRTRR